MAGRLAIDFGNANTVIALWDDQAQQAKPVKLEPFSRMHPWQDEQIPIIPSLIHYKPDGSYLVGNEVLQANLAVHEHTFVALKTSFDAVHTVKIGDIKVSAQKAAEDFLRAVLRKAIKVFAIRPDEQVVLAVPVDAFEKYSKWLSDVAAKSGLRNIRFIDEPAAAALSFGKTVKQNDDYLIFDFGAGSLDVAVVRFKLEERSVRVGHCKVLGKKSMQLGGNNIDQWLTRQFFDHHQIDPASDQARSLLWLLTNECRAAKEKLSFADSADIAVTDYQTGKALTLQLKQQSLIDALEEHEFFLKVDRTIRAAEHVAQFDHGYKRDKLSGIFMVGGTSIIPELQKQLRRTFGKERVQLSRPLDSIAAGAAAFAAGVTLYDHIQHDYAIEVMNLQKQKAQMKVIIQRGEKYPSQQAVAIEILKAATYGQTKFQLLIYEISKEEIEPGSEFIDLAQVVHKDDQVLRYVCLNKNHPTLLETQRPIMYSHPALQIDFRIDENKHLVIDTYKFETDEIKVSQMKGVVVVKLS
jgi:molecular chaperone DnaK (HSP70)